ncbi:hypothetical protein [Ferruginibacter sp.]|uniref:hypothetical protein n=1 Tax=Ferruginibacter sp. TaxID=1940288 RepID=UPI0026598BDF|nr:hypothetical protein [Ferruginibacter sp.]
MRDALKNLFAEQINLEDGSVFYYTTQPYELKNALGSVVAVLQQYHFTKKDDQSGPFSRKLYRTKEGNWYDFEEAKSGAEKVVLRMLKSAIDVKENETV